VEGEVEEYVEGEVEEYNEEEFLQRIRAETAAFLRVKEVEVEVEEHDKYEFPHQMRAEPLPGVGSGSSLATGHQAVARLGLVDHRGREAARKVVLAVVKQLSVEDAVEVLEQLSMEDAVEVLEPPHLIFSFPKYLGNRPPQAMTQMPILPKPTLLRLEPKPKAMPDCAFGATPKGV
jgi:hypothetical protein